MTYIAQLVHRALVERPTFTKSDTDERVPSYDPVDGMDQVRCLFVPGMTRAAMQLFGNDAQLDATAYFGPKTDIRPNLQSNKGDQDKLTIRDRRGNLFGVFFVTDTRDPMVEGLLLVAGLRKAPR